MATLFVYLLASLPLCTVLSQIILSGAIWFPRHYLFSSSNGKPCNLSSSWEPGTLIWSFNRLVQSRSYQKSLHHLFFEQGLNQLIYVYCWYSWITEGSSFKHMLNEATWFVFRSFSMIIIVRHLLVILFFINGHSSSLTVSLYSSVARFNF